MIDVYLQESPKGEGYVRICDFGMALMRLSYTFDITTSTRQQIFDSILINNNINNDDGNLYLDAPISLLYESILQFAGCVQKVCNMRYWSREVVRSAFYDDLRDYVTTELRRFFPTPTTCHSLTIPSSAWTGHSSTTGESSMSWCAGETVRLRA